MAAVKVRYKGLSDVRELSAKDLAERGIKVDRDLVFSVENGWSMDVEMNDELEQLLRREGSFTISKIDDQGNVSSDVVTATKSDDTADAAVVEDKTTGQKSSKK